MVYGDEISVLYYMKSLPVVTSLIESDEETEDEYERYYRPNSLVCVTSEAMILLTYTSLLSLSMVLIPNKEPVDRCRARYPHFTIIMFPCLRITMQPSF